jgi:hypothetical protein
LAALVAGSNLYHAMIRSHFIVTFLYFDERTVVEDVFTGGEWMQVGGRRKS